MAAQITDGTGEIFIGTRDGLAIRFPEGDVRPMGRTAYGVKGITLREGDEVVAMEVVRPGSTLLTVAENGYGKRTELDEYRVQSRGGVGIINIQTTERNGRVVGMASVHDEDEFMLITQQGKILRTVARDIRTIALSTLYDPKSWIFHPRRVLCEVSADGSSWRPVGAFEIDGDQRREDTTRTFAWETPLRGVRFIRFAVAGTRVNPAWHASAGGASWVFVDEIVVR
jgi:DNA gyrase/topoisomerase IV subunit A